MICPNCTKNEMEEYTVESYHFTECGLDDVWLKEWPLLKCGNCGMEAPRLPNPEEFTKWLVEELIKQETRLNGDEIFFVRKAMGMTGAQLAELLGVQRVEVSRWENDRHPISFQADYKLRMEAAERLLSGQSEEELNELYVAVAQTLRTYKRDVRDTRITIGSRVHRHITGDLAIAAR